MDIIENSIKSVFTKLGILKTLKFILFGDGKEEIARALIKDLKKKNLKAEELLNPKTLWLSNYELAKRLGEEGIFYDREERLIKVKKNGELIPIAYVGQEIYPLKGMKETVEKVLRRIIEIKKELMEDEIFVSTFFKYLPQGEEIAEEMAEGAADSYRLNSNRIEDEFSKTLKNLYNIPEIDFNEIKERRRIERENRINSIKALILDKLPYLKNNPKAYVFDNFDEDELYNALKDLENESKKYKIHKKIKALRKIFENKKGISRKKKLAILLGGLLVAGVAAYGLKNYINQENSPKIYSIDYPNEIKTNDDLPIKIDASADKVIVQVNENGIIKNFTAKYSNIFYVDVPIKEGIYKIEKIYAFKDGKVFVKDVNAILRAFDNPIIYSVEYERKSSPGKEAIVKVNATDTSGIEEAIMQVNAPDGTFKINASKENGLYVFKFPLKKEPSYNFTIYLIDPFNQTSTYNGSISSLDNPVINSVKINKIYDEGLVNLLVNATDTSGIKNALIEFNSRNLTLTRLPNGLYSYNFTFGLEPNSIPIKLYFFDPYNNSATYSGEISWLLADAFSYYASKNNISPQVAQNFYNNYQSFVEALYSNQRDLLIPPLKIFNSNSTLFDEIYKRVKTEPQIYNSYRNIFVSKECDLVLNLNLQNISLKRETINTLGNLTVAYNQLNLPIHDKNYIWLFTNATQKNPAIADFDPIIIKDATNQTIIIQSKNFARDYWMIAEFLKNRPDIVNQIEKYEWINRMIQQVAWDIFDSPYGPNSQWIEPKTGKVHYPESLTPTSQEVWQVILSFHDYMDNLPSKLKKDGIGVIVLYNDQNAMKAYINDKTNRTIALLYLADLPSETFDKTSKQIITGINAMKKFVEQLPSEYEEIVSKLNSPQWKDETLTWYAGWIIDRGNHGLANTVSQFIGANYNEIKTMDELKQIIENTNINGITQFLKKNWKYWDLIKFIYGYESFKAGDWGGEWEMYRYGLPIAFKAFGIPYNQGIGASATSGNFGGYNSYGLVEFTIYGIPQDVIDKLLNQKELGKVVIGYGNGISLMSCKDGVEKDTGYEIFQWSPRWSKIYLWKK